MTDAETVANYAHTYSYKRWGEHVDRIRHTTEIAQRIINTEELKHVTDLSCGDGAIINSLTGVDTVRNDFSINGDGIEVTSKIMKPTDLFICSETIEHLREPWTVLEQIAMNTKWLVLSTPLDEDISVGNWEHYWSFEKRDIQDILEQSCFTPVDHIVLLSAGWTYEYQIWTARSTHAWNWDRNTDTP